MTPDNRSSSKWYVLMLAALTMTLGAGMARFCMPVLFKEISEDLSLSLVQIGTIWGMDPLAGIFVSFISGLLVDRFGIKRTLSVITLFMGIISALRGLSIGFISLAGTMFVFGLLVATTPTVCMKVAALWFKDSYLGLSTGIITMGGFFGGMAAAMLSATFLSPFLGGWRNVLFLYGLPPVVVGLLWLSTYREGGKFEAIGSTENKISLLQALSHVIRVKQVWTIGIIQLGRFAVYIGITGYLPIYLRGIGWSATAADSAMSALVGSIGACAVPLAILSDALGSRKRLLLLALIILVATLFLIPLSQGISIWIWIILNGLMIGGVIPLFVALTVETKGIGPKYAGTAMGLVGSLGMLGGFLAAPLGNSVAHINPGLPFALWAVLCGITLFGFLFLKDRK